MPRGRTALTLSALCLSLAAATSAGAAFAQGGDTSPEPVTKPCPGDQQYYPDEDASRFWECSNGIAYRFDCAIADAATGERLQWDQAKLTCVWPAKGERTTTAPALPSHPDL
ncbi:carbohydrate-binding module family 14 protein [Streptomyces sp. NPDC012765]|uniref:carbohydrate-binding module family 14 protein n=1 Tax=Streptomyces sp. NPDC012765 TaxID=3155249 RepID=UPI0033D7E884